MNYRDLIYRFKTAEINLKFIYINILVFVFGILLGVFSPFFNKYGFVLDSILALSSEHFIYRPWTFLTYSFYHVSFLHLIFNMLILYSIGRIFMQYLDATVFVKLYILGSISGGILFLLLYNNLQDILAGHSLLLGASASIMAIVIGIATYVFHTFA